MDRFQERKIDFPRQYNVSQQDGYHRHRATFDPDKQPRQSYVDYKQSPKQPHCGEQSIIRPLHSSQDYKKLRDKLRSSGRLFEDDKFPADNRLLTDNAAGGNIVHYFGGNRVRASEIEWLRPKVFMIYGVCSN